MLSRTLATMALGVLALCSGAAMAQGHEGGHENGGATARAVAYHGGHYSYHYGGYRGSYGYPGWYGPSVGVYVGAPAYGLWGYPYYPGAVYGPSAAIPYPPDAPPMAGSFSPPDAGQGPAPSSYWYYCANPAGYYPNVQQCPSGWTQVAPQGAPPGQ